MEEKVRSRVYRELSFRLWIAVVAAFCFAGSSLLFGVVGFLWVTGWQVPAVTLVALWMVITLPWLTLALITFGDFLLFAASGRTFFVPTLMAWGRLEEQHRALANRPPFERSTARRIFSEVGFYTNPLAPLLLVVTAYLMNKPGLVAVDEAVHRINQRRATAVFLGDASVDLRRHVGGRHPAAA